MGLETADIEGEAEALYRAAGLDSGTAAPVLWLATELLGAGAVCGVHTLRAPGGGCLTRVNGQVRIYFRNRLPPERRDFVVGHELAHWALGEACGDERELEAACDALSAALIAPRRAFLKLAQRHGPRFGRLARAFATTESLVALRLGETTLEPVALVTPATVRVRGAVYSWPSADGIRSLAQHPRPGLRKAELRDAPRRIALLA